MPAVKEGFVQEIIERYESDPGMLIPMMQDLQAEYGYLPPEELKRLSKELSVPLTRVYGVAMFYASFRLVPKGRHEVTLCMGTVCHLKGAPRISEAICTEYAIQPGGTTADRLFTLQAVNCVGACALAPVMIVDGKYYAGVSPDSALEVLRVLAAEAEGPEAGQPAAAAAPEAQEAAPAAGSALAAAPEAQASAPETGQPAVPELAVPLEQPPAPVPEKKAPPQVARTAPKARPKAKAAAGPKAGSGSGKAKTKPASSAKKGKPAQAAKNAKKDKPGGATKRAAKGAKKGGRR